MEVTQRIEIDPKSRQKRSAWYLLTGLIIGLIIGLFYASVINPIVYQDIDPASLSEADKDAYRLIIAQVYAVTGNFSRASQRLNLLADENPVFALGLQAQRELGAGDDEKAHALALLASDLEMPILDQTPTPASTEPVPKETEVSIPTQTLPVLTPVP